MYYATKRNNTQTRMIGVATVVLVNVGAAVAVLNGFGSMIMKAPVESEVVIIEEVPEVEEEPPPPPPIDVELPPPPPQVILPQFIVETPPPRENQITQVVATPQPAAPAPVQARPAPAPVAVGLRSKPQSGRRFEKPDYPAAALRAGEQGEVTVSVCVDVNGRMSDVKLVKSSGSSRLDDATVRGMSKTRLEPAIGTDGKPMAYCDPPHLLTIVWDLEAEKKNR